MSVRAQVTNVINEKVQLSSESAANEVSDFFIKYLEIVNQMGENEALLEMFRQVQTPGTLADVNASIEAARAGEAGRGFSVVAKSIWLLIPCYYSVVGQSTCCCGRMDMIQKQKCHCEAIQNAFLQRCWSGTEQ